MKLFDEFDTGKVVTIIVTKRRCLIYIDKKVKTKYTIFYFALPKVLSRFLGLPTVLDRRPKFYGHSQRFKTYGYGYGG